MGVSEIIAVVALIVSTASYFHTRKVFKFSSYPFLKINLSLKPSRRTINQEPNQRFEVITHDIDLSVENLSKSIPVVDLNVSVYLKVKDLLNLDKNFEKKFLYSSFNKEALNPEESFAGDLILHLNNIKSEKSIEKLILEQCPGVLIERIIPLESSEEVKNESMSKNSEESRKQYELYINYQGELRSSLPEKTLVNNFLGCYSTSLLKSFEILVVTTYRPALHGAKKLKISKRYSFSSIDCTNLMVDIDLKKIYSRYLNVKKPNHESKFLFELASFQDLSSDHWFVEEIASDNSVTHYLRKLLSNNSLTKFRRGFKSFYWRLKLPALNKVDFKELRQHRIK